jgi:hypothetical protein
MSHGGLDAAHVVITPRGQAKLLDAGLTTWLGGAREPVDDIAALGRLLSAMTGPGLPRAQWADELRLIIERTAPEHPRRYQSVASLAAELRSVSAMLEARAEAIPAAAGASVGAIVLWSALALVLLALGLWLLLR